MAGAYDRAYERAYTVSEVNTYIKSLLTYDPNLSSIWIKGEISNYKRHYSGHLYFTLKDSNSLLKCVMFRSSASSLKFEPENGMKVLVRGNISVFERDGVYQLYAEIMQPDGIGELHIAFEQLKKKLASEGLFDDSRKKPIPKMPRVIGVVTSETGSVIRDIRNVINRRFPRVHLRLYPVAVQGEGAAQQIADAVDNLNRHNMCDVIIIARGGGSLEELWAFNEEVLARAVSRSRIPVISAVGHETDFTICDFVSDLRAPTPSAAAELAVPEIELLYQKLGKLKLEVSRIPQHNIDIKKQQLLAIKSRSFFRRPLDGIHQRQQYVSQLFDLTTAATQRQIHNCRQQMAAHAGKLDALSPLKILSRGYGYISDSCGNLISSVNQINENDIIDVSLKDGRMNCEVKEIRKWLC